MAPTWKCDVNGYQDMRRPLWSIQSLPEWRKKSSKEEKQYFKYDEI